MAAVRTVYSAIQSERIRAHQKHGPLGQSMEEFGPLDRRWMPVLTEEFLEAVREINDLEFKPAERPQVLRRVRDELLQVAAVCCAMVESIDRAGRGTAVCCAMVESIDRAGRGT